MISEDKDYADPEMSGFPRGGTVSEGNGSVMSSTVPRTNSDAYVREFAKIVKCKL